MILAKIHPLIGFGVYSFELDNFDFHVYKITSWIQMLEYCIKACNNQFIIIYLLGVLIQSRHYEFYCGLFTNEYVIA